jgi:hypothetical protein
MRAEISEIVKEQNQVFNKKINKSLVPGTSSSWQSQYNLIIIEKRTSVDEDIK